MASRAQTGGIAPICPHCRRETADSGDHLFPAFLGGRTEVRACSPCNSKFGHTFEAAVSKDLAPFVVALAKCGLKPPRSAVWKDAFSDPTTGLSYNLDSSNTLTLAKPHLVRDAGGRLKQMTFPSTKTAKKAAATLKQKGHARDVVITESSVMLVNPALNSFQIVFGPEVRRLCVKMCCALVARHDPDLDPLSEGCRRFLLDRPPFQIPVRQSFVHYAALQTLRTPLCHSVFVSGDPKNGSCFGIVQLFGAFQFFAPLRADYNGRRFVQMAILDTRTYTEHFLAPDLSEALPESPARATPEELQEGARRCFDSLNQQVYEVFGENVLVIGGTPANPRP